MMLQSNGHRSARVQDSKASSPVAGVDQGQPVVALDQEGVCEPHRDEVHTFDHTLHSHERNPEAVLRLDFTKQDSRIFLRDKSGKIIAEKGGTGVEPDCVRRTIPQTNSQRLSCSMRKRTPPTEWCTYSEVCNRLNRKDEQLQVGRRYARRSIRA